MTTATQTNVGTSAAHTQIDLAKIHPNQGAKYSPNLHEFLRASRNKASLQYLRVYRDSKDVLWLGYYFDGDFIGTRLMQVLSYGKKATMFSYSQPSMEEVVGFWDEYKAIGRCAVDKAHVIAFTGDETRWENHEDHRNCRWCGQVTQYKKTFTETITRERWVNA